MMPASYQFTIFYLIFYVTQIRYFYAKEWMLKLINLGANSIGSLDLAWNEFSTKHLRIKIFRTNDIFC